MPVKLKSYTQTYIYTQYPKYENDMLKYIITADRIDQTNRSFDQIINDLKRQKKISDKLIKILSSKNVVLFIHPGKPLPKALRTYVAKDTRTDKSVKVFIDVTDVIVDNNNQYVCNNYNALVAYLIDAMIKFIYAVQGQRLIGNSSVVRDGGIAFMKCFTYIMNRMYKVYSMPTLAKRIQYVSAMYYQINLLQKDKDKSFDNIKSVAMKLSDIDSKDAKIVDMMIGEHDFDDISKFVDALGRMFELKDIKLSNVVYYWREAFDAGSIYGLEYFPTFATILTNTYIGGYVNSKENLILSLIPNQVTTFTKSILQIGESVVR